MSMIRDVMIAALWQGRDPFQDIKTSQNATVPTDAALDTDALVASLTDVINRRLPQVVLDVGAGGGSTTLAIARHFHERQHNGVVIAVDTWLGGWEPWCERHGANRLRLESGRPMLQSAFMERVQAHGLERYVVPLPLDDQNGSVVLKRKRLHCDAICSDLRLPLMAIEARLKLWWPLLRGGGRLLANVRQSDQHAYMQTRQMFEIFVGERAAACHAVEGLMWADKPEQMSLTAHSQEHSLTKMPDVARVLDYEGEFGPELAIFLPYVTWLSEAGLLRHSKVVIHSGMRCFYDHLDCGELVEKHALRRHIKDEDRLAILPVKSEQMYAERSPFHLFPDLRKKFRQLPIPLPFNELSKPLVIVHNKFAIEWNRSPVNFFGPELLDALFQHLEREFTVVYIRHGMRPQPADYSADDNFTLPFDERAVLDAHPDVWCFDDTYADYKNQGGAWDLNTYKNVLYSRCHHFISTQGGGTMHMTLFSGALLMILHRYGREERLAYGNGFYGFAANPAPIRVICLNDDELLRGMRLFHDSWVMDDRVMISRDLNPLLQDLSPSTLEKRRDGKWSR